MTVAKCYCFAVMLQFHSYAEVLIPGGAPEALTYGVPDSCELQAGQWVLVPLARRKDLQLGLTLAVHHNPPTFAVRPLEVHPSLFQLNSQSLDALLWTARYYCTPVGRVLDASLSAEFPKYLSLLHSPPKRRLREHQRSNDPWIQAPDLTKEQQQAISTLEPLLQGTGFRGALLHGVTGSGKTRVYLELVQKCLEQGGKVLILVPEIGLTPQTRDRFQMHLKETVYLYHSNLSAPEKRATWIALLKGEARVLLGTRSAILAPNLSPDLIIIDEEHDSSYKQQDPAPRYHCRDLAFHLAHKHGALVLLGSATPSLESYELAQRGHIQLVTLKQRARPVALPAVRIVDLRQESRQDQKLLLSPPLREALCDHIAKGNQAIVLHNRRGFATSRQCIDCGEIMHCEHCRVPVILHRQHNGLLCHYCNRLYPLNTPCSHCKGQHFEFGGGAIEKAELEIAEWVPGAKILRMDRDTVQQIGSAERMLHSFRQGEFNVLLGTQMVAKGHDFPNVQLVGVIAADVGASLPDFRAGERLFQMITQVAGRAGRAQAGGQVILQTWNPEDSIFRFALQHDFEGFARRELQLRQELGYPPFQRLFSIEISGKSIHAVEQVCEIISQQMKAHVDILTLGPAEAFVSIVRGHHRRHFLFKAPNPHVLRVAVNPLEKKIPATLLRQVSLRLDPDPMGFV